MGLRERFLGRTKRENVAQLIVIYETRAVPVLRSYIATLTKEQQVTAEMVMDKVDRSILALIVTDTMGALPQPKATRASEVKPQ
jgi:hypothetical protein